MGTDFSPWMDEPAYRDYREIGEIPVRRLFLSAQLPSEVGCGSLATVYSSGYDREDEGHCA